MAHFALKPTGNQFFIIKIFFFCVIFFNAESLLKESVYVAFSMHIESLGRIFVFFTLNVLCVIINERKQRI